MVKNSLRKKSARGPMGGGIENYAGFGDCDHMIGVSGDEDTIEAIGEVEFTECEEE